ncbi:MAG: RNA 2'-phosphotransferase, partial [Actinobacteria bacterium]|nr:RNA 2'-phosphotransferase [Actinomycetota bacterium]
MTRRRLSKAMAFQLRHGSDVTLAAGGWARVDELRVRADGAQLAPCARSGVRGHVCRAARAKRMP